MRAIRTQRFVRGQQEQKADNNQENETEGLAPFITEVCGGHIPVNNIQIVQIKGYHFTPNITIDTGDNGSTEFRSNRLAIEVSLVRFINPTLVEAVIVTGDSEGKFNLVVRNGDLDSGDTGNDTIVITNARWIDLRTTSVIDLGLQNSPGVIINRNLEKGLWGINRGSEFAGVVKFSAFSWKRCDDLSFSIVFTLDKTEGTSLLGIGGFEIDVTNLGPVPLFEAESHLFMVNGTSHQMYGGGSRYRRWRQDIGGTVTFEASKFYKLNYNFSATKTLMTIAEVDSNDFDQNLLLLRQWSSDSPSDSGVLVPYWTVGSNSNLFLTAFKIG